MDKHLTKFVGLFSSIDFAANYLENPDSPYVKESYDFHIKHIKYFADVIEQSSAQPYNSLQNEIENNLYNFPQSREIYVNDIIRKLAVISRYLDITAKEEYSNPDLIKSETVWSIKNGNLISDNSSFTLKLISKYLKQSFTLQKISIEEYVITCYFLLRNFSTILDGLCIKFQITKFQDQSSRRLFKERDFQLLLDMGYESDIESWSEYKQFVKRNKERFSGWKQLKNSKITIKNDDTPNDNEIEPIKTFITDYNTNELKKIRENLLKEKFINEIKESDFLYLFTDKPIHEKMVKLFWKASYQKCTGFLRRTVYKESDFSFVQLNQCIKFPNGKILDSNNKAPLDANRAILGKILNVKKPTHLTNPIDH